MGREQRHNRRRTVASDRQPRRLPCGCAAADLAAEFGMTEEDVLRAAERARDPSLGSGPLLLTVPIDGSCSSSRPGGVPPKGAPPRPH